MIFSRHHSLWCVNSPNQTVESVANTDPCLAGEAVDELRADRAELLAGLLAPTLPVPKARLSTVRP